MGIYGNSITNHYARIVHAANLDGRGYCFLYGDVTPNGGVDQRGFVSDGSPASLLVTVGGGNADARRELEVLEPKGGMVKRSLGWEEDVKAPVVVGSVEQERDLEMGVHPKLLNEFETSSEARTFKLPAIVDRVLGPQFARLQASPFYMQRVAPLVALISQLLISLLSLSIRTIVSQVFIVVFFLLFYFLGLLPRGSNGET
ncbi:hypothetical protein DL95DRAFT_462848 [Leptodontidium sp. 2 PMI_412]|nr:hypothetical protein DL95DRAFT_462848 [Leptodontidium sp. 2 PMI_412]